MKTLTIVSGKGGVGKSTITASLAVLLSKSFKIVAADCDIDASNLSLALGARKTKKTFSISTSKKAEIIQDSCTSCGLCYANCVFGAVLVNKDENKYKIDKYLCEGCNTCSIVCPENAIVFYSEETADITISEADGFYVVSGQLRMGQSGSGKIVDKVKEESEKIAKQQSAEIRIIDSAAGIGCPVVSSIHGSDYVIAVTEPTPSALSDLERVLHTVLHFNIDYGIIINKADLNPEFTKKLVQKYGKKIIATISYNRTFVDSLVALTPVVNYDPSFVPLFEEIKAKIVNKLQLKQNNT